MPYLYSEGVTLRLRSHQPPQPFGDSCYKKPFNGDSTYIPSWILEKIDQSGYVFTKLPRERAEGSVLPAFAEKYFGVADSLQLKAIKMLATHKERGPQVICCSVEKMPALYWAKMGYTPAEYPSKVVAKIYDPLYYPETNEIGHRCDVVSYADKEYALEAAAYTELHNIQSTGNPVVQDFVPKFFGTWTVEQKTSSKNTAHSTRPVRIILMEYIDGPTLVDMCSKRFDGDFRILVPPATLGDEEERLAIFARVLEGAAVLTHLGVFHEDIEPDNVILQEVKEELPKTVTSRLGSFASPTASSRHKMVSRTSRPDKPKTATSTPIKRLPETAQQTPTHKGSKLARPPKWRVVLVDYGASEVGRYTELGVHLGQILPRPAHPYHRFNTDHLDCFTGIIPLEWAHNQDAFDDWMLKPFDVADYTMGEEIDQVEAGEEYQGLVRRLEQEERSATATATATPGHDEEPAGGDAEEDDSVGLQSGFSNMDLERQPSPLPNLLDTNPADTNPLSDRTNRPETGGAGDKSGQDRGQPDQDPKKGKEN